MQELPSHDKRSIPSPSIHESSPDKSFNPELEPGVTYSDEDLQQILALQKTNLKQHLSSEEKATEGFLTMQFDMEMLRKLHDLAPAIVVRSKGQIIAYAIVLLKEGRFHYPDLESMFLNLETILWKERPLSAYNYYVMGQICVDKAFRGKNVFQLLYDAHRRTYSQQYDCIITEISTSNTRSMRAHEKVGFEVIAKYRDYLDEWNVVIWDWHSFNSR